MYKKVLVHSNKTNISMHDIDILSVSIHSIRDTHPHLVQIGIRNQGKKI